MSDTSNRAFIQLPEGAFSQSGDILGSIRRRTFFALSIVSWIIILILTLAVLVPRISQTLALRAHVVALRDDIAKKQTQLATLASLTQSQIVRDQEVLRGVLPQEKPVLPLLYSLDRLAIASQVSVSNFTISPGLLGTGSAKLDANVTPTTISPILLALPLKMNVTGQFENLRSFFTSLDSVVPFIQVDSIEFGVVQSTTAPVVASSSAYTADVKLSTLYIGRALKGDGDIVLFTKDQQDLLSQLTQAYTQRETDAANERAGIASPSGKTNLFAPL